jgi:regulator of cell morphogenesis and NO signaling
MTASPTSTVGAIASRYPQTIRVFQRLRVEFCCDGRLTLAELCRDRNLPFDDLADALEAALAAPVPPRQDWTTRPLVDLADHISETFHEPLLDELPRLHQMAAKVGRHGDPSEPRYAAVLSELGKLGSDLRRHVAETEHALFPLIDRVEAGRTHERDRHSFDRLRETLEADHAEARLILQILRSSTDGYDAPAHACATVRALYRGLKELEQLMQLHVHLENNVLFPRAAALIANARIVRPS